MASGMILAAGFGTRLRPLSDELPKPLLPLGDEPMLVRAVRRLHRAGLGPLAFNTHHLAAAFGVVDLAAFGVTALHEEKILGTAGGVANARAVLGPGDVLVWNGDLEADVDIVGLVTARRSSSDDATLLVAPRSRGEGTVGLDASGALVRLRGERFGDESTGGDFLGIHVIGARLVASLPVEGCLAGDVYLPALRRGARLGTFAHHGPWDDIGSVAAYLRANLRWLGERSSFVAPSAEIAGGVALERAVIGAGAVVTGEGALRDVVVWPGARAAAPLASAIVTPRGVVPAG